MSDTFEFADEQRWFEVTEPADGVFAIREPLHDHKATHWFDGFGICMRPDHRASPRA